MEVIGRGSINIYEGVDEHPHLPDNEHFWQESFVILLWDIEQEVYVFLRLNQEPNLDAGYTSVWLNAWVPGYMYRNVDHAIPLAPEDRGEKSLRAAGGLCQYEYDGKYHWTVTDKEVHMNLVMEDYHPGFCYYPQSAGSAVTKAFKHHIEASGWASGSVTVKDKTYQVKGPAWRDHSWGKRDWTNLVAHRFYPAMFGPDFSFFCVTLLAADGSLAKVGTIIRGNTVEATSDFDIVAYIGEDGISNCGGRVTLRTQGKSHVLHFEPVGKGSVALPHDFAITDTMCTVTMDGRQGVGLAETSNRAQGGTKKPHILPTSLCIMENGLHKF